LRNQKDANSVIVTQVTSLYFLFVAGHQLSVLHRTFV